LPAGGGSFVLVEEQNQFALAASFHPQPQPGFDPAAQFDRVADWVRDNRETFVASNITRDDPFEVNEPVSFVTAYVAVPLLDGDKLLGILFVLEARGPRHFNPDEMDFVGELAGRAAMAIAKARLYAELSEANHHLERQSALLQVRNEQLVQAKAKVEIASDAKSEFLAKVSHELRTPMNGVIGMTDYLLMTGLSQEQRESAEVVRTSADRLLTQIDRLLDFSRLDTGLFTPTLVEFNVREMARVLIEKAESARGHKPVAIHATVDSEVPEQLRGDANAMRRALWNLLDNAVRFTDRGEVALEVASIPAGDGKFTLKFTIRDTGHGISAAARERLFDPFAQVDNSLARNHEGLGLGLATTHRLVQRMHGVITVESTPGQGSVFKLSVPAETVVTENAAASVS
jgi:signal transduction histidine kinase